MFCKALSVLGLSIVAASSAFAQQGDLPTYQSGNSSLYIQQDSPGGYAATTVQPTPQGQTIYSYRGPEQPYGTVPAPAPVQPQWQPLQPQWQSAPPPPPVGNPYAGVQPSPGIVVITPDRAMQMARQGGLNTYIQQQHQQIQQNALGQIASPWLDLSQFPLMTIDPK